MAVPPPQADEATLCRNTSFVRFIKTVILIELSDQCDALADNSADPRHRTLISFIGRHRKIAR
jgi:hypothetical protein